MRKTETSIRVDNPTRVQTLLELIEIQLQWGTSDQWTGKDFETLSDKILEYTGQRLSVTTLKRVWGRTSHRSGPSISTLDILSHFVGFENWRSFTHQQEASTKDQSIPTRLPSAINSQQLAIVILVITLLVVAFRVTQRQTSQKTLPDIHPSADSIQFDFQKITIGYPNTVIFRYDIGDMPFDTLQIQQSWDRQKRIMLDAPNGIATTTYYSPGYYRTKLVVDDQIVKEKDLYIPTSGWQAFIGGNVPTLIYLDEDQLVLDSVVTFQPQVLEELNQYIPSHIGLYHLSPDPSLSSEQFTFHTQFRLAQPTDKSICKYVTLVITGTKDVLRFQFSIPGCVGELFFALNGDMISGRQHDLSNFGIDPIQWNHFQVSHRDDTLTAFLNEKKIFTHTIQEDIGLIGGVGYFFDGLGAVKQTSFNGVPLE